MKLGLVFALCFFVISAQAQVQAPVVPLPGEIEEFGIVTDGLKDIIEAVIKLAQKVINDTLNAVQKIVDKVQQTINTILDTVQGLIDAVIRKIEEIVDKIAAQSEKARECVNKYRPEIQGAREKARDQVQACNNQARESAAALGNNIKQHIASIQKYIEESRSIVTTCLENESNPITGLGCVLEKSHEIREKIILAVREVGKTLSDIRSESVKIGDEFRQCSRNVSENLQSELGEVVKKIQNCVAEAEE